MKAILKKYIKQLIMCLFLLSIGITHGARAQLIDTCAQHINYLKGAVDVTSPNQGSISSLENGSIKIDGLIYNDKSGTNALTYSSNYIEIKEGEFTGYTSIVAFDSIINYFEASEYFDFGKIKLNWSQSDIFTNLNHGKNITPKIFFSRTDQDGNVTIIDTCININDLEYVDEDLKYGGKFLYCAQGFTTDKDGNILQLGTRYCDYGQTDKFKLEADNNSSDAEIQIQWDIDANCLEGENGEDVYFQVKDLTTDEEVYIQTIEDPSAYLYFGSFTNNYSLNFNGQNSRVNLPEYSIEGKSNWTAECWIKIATPKNTEGSHYIFSNENTSGLYYSYLNDKEATLKYNTKNGNYSNLGITIPVDKWVHIALTSGTINTRFYINGIYQTSVKDAVPWTFDYLGSHTTEKTMNGILAHFRLWDDIRTTQEISYNYLYGFQGDEHSLEAYYLLDEGDIATSFVKDETQRYHATSVSTTITTFIENTEENKEFHYIITENVHQQEYHNYQLGIYTIGKGDQVCDVITAEAQTAPLNINTKVMASDDDPGCITIAWRDLDSDWAAGYKVYRKEEGTTNWKYLSTIQDASIKYYEDYFSFNSDNSIKIGINYEYMVNVINNKYGEIPLNDTPVGKTFNYDINLQTKNDSILITWPEEFSETVCEIGYDTLKITRDGEVLRYTTVFDEPSAIDPFPIYGKEHKYGLIFVKNGKDYAGVFKTNKLSENGTINGRVLTAIGKYPVVNANITVETEVDGTINQVQTTTDNLGYYSLDNLYYGETSNAYVTPNLLGHTFVNQSNTHGSTTVALNRFEHKKESVDFFSLREYEVVSNEKHTISSLSIVNTADTVQFFKFNWNNNLEIPSNYTDIDLYFNIYRDDELISTLVRYLEADDKKGIHFTEDIIFTDSTASPGKTYDYTVYSYYFEGDNNIYSKNISKQFSWRKVPNYITNFAALSNTSEGVVELSWTNEKKWNCDGYILERKSQGSNTMETIAVIKNASSTRYTDEESASGAWFTYYITPFINNSGSEMVSAQTALESTTQYPVLKTPIIRTNADSIRGYITLNVELELNTPKNEYNFDGIKVSRISSTDTIEIADITIEALNLLPDSESDYFYQLTDKNGAPSTSYKYQAAIYKNTQSGLIVSGYGESTIAYPALPMPTLTATYKHNIIDLKLSYDADANIDGVYLSRWGNKGSHDYRIGPIEVGKMNYLDAIN